MNMRRCVLFVGAVLFSDPILPSGWVQHGGKDDGREVQGVQR